VKKRTGYIFLFAAYCALMAWLLFGRERYDAPMGYWQQIAANINPLPGETIVMFMRFLVYDYSEALKRHAIVNLVGNVIMFVPLGYFTSLLWERFRPLWRCLLWGAGIIVCVELTQLFALVGSCDLDDLILNVVGIGLGYGLCKVTARRKETSN
jgi:glycopeptide antibiotics resistance protein